MPELPEVETIRRQLAPEVVGRTITDVEVFDERWTRPDPPSRLEQAVAGRRVEAVDRRGKYLILRLDGGWALIMHLRMTGNLLLRAADEPARAAAASCAHASSWTTARSCSSPTHAGSGTRSRSRARTPTPTLRPGWGSSLCRTS